MPYQQYVANRRPRSASRCWHVARRAVGGPPSRPSPPLAPGSGAAQRRRLDLNTAEFGSALFCGRVLPPCIASCGWVICPVKATHVGRGPGLLVGRPGRRLG